MTDAMTHRGPNDRGVYAAPGIALGVRRLSIVDVAGGHQPFPSEDERVWAIQNGELYNHEAIRAELAGRGHTFRSRCDTEILPHLYEEVGEALPARLRGKFGIAVWDERTRQTLVARDRLGVKPLYYATVDDVVVFASELKSVLASGLVDLELDLAAIDAYLTLGYFPAPLTPLLHVRKLLPAHRLIVGDGRVRTEPYWEFPTPAPDPRLTEHDAAEQLRAELEDSVRVRLMSDVPLGAMLSGGLDSSLLVALMARNMAEPVKTFSVGFVEDGAQSELADAALVAREFGTDHHPLELSMGESPISLEDLVWALDEPLADLSALGFMALSGLAAQDVTVALAGQGSDELFGGYSRHRRARLIDQAGPLARLGPVAERAIGQRSDRHARFARAAGAADPASRYLALRTPFLSSELRSRLVRSPLRGDDLRAHEIVAGHARKVDGGALVSTRYLDSQLGLVDDMLHYSDRVSMAYSLEVRVPFLDPAVVALAARIPMSLKVRRGSTKHLVKQVARGLVPQEVIDKPKTGFFNRAVDSWLRLQLDHRAGDYLMSEQAAYRQFLDGDAVRSLVADSRAGRLVPADSLLALLVLEVWLSTFLPRAAAEARRPVTAAS
jgi:asparagine synthase (glutamine-hydrolysing)